MENKTDIIDKLVSTASFIEKSRNKGALMASENKKAWDDVVKDLDYQLTENFAKLVFFGSNNIPVGSAFLDEVKKTATEKELNVLEKHGVKL